MGTHRANDLRGESGAQRYNRPDSNANCLCEQVRLSEDCGWQWIKNHAVNNDLELREFVFASSCKTHCDVRENCASFSVCFYGLPLMIPSRTEKSRIAPTILLSPGTGFRIPTANYTARTALHIYVRSPRRISPCTICQSLANGVIGQNGARVMFPVALWDE